MHWECKLLPAMSGAYPSLHLAKPHPSHVVEWTILSSEYSGIPFYELSFHTLYVLIIVFQYIMIMVIE